MTHFAGSVFTLPVKFSSVMPIQEPCVHLQFPVHHEAGQATSSPCADSLWVLAVTRPVQHALVLYGQPGQGRLCELFAC